MSPVQRGSAAALAPSAPVIADPRREFAFSDADFQDLARLAYEHAGIVLGESKRNLVYSRLSRRLRTLNLDSFAVYREYLNENAREVENFVNSISTNHTKFFRESHHFDHFRSHVAGHFAQLARGNAASRLRIWSAGCSSGEEPYTIAVVLRHQVPDIARYDARILATDIDTDILAKGVRGEYPANVLDEVPAAYQDYFEKAGGARAASTVVMAEEIRKLIAYRQLNLLGAWPMKGLFDAIFCRNVMIYFDGPTKAKLVERFTQQLKPGGWLYIGHSESLIGSHPGLQLVGRTIYRREP
ncbi:MAG TPA: protein-glutamate O-methyltransferase CheR [Xanthobacteraceae bacterium]|nr:protein-glutamate O-methyltransferase CheR [Xanthobacteraceae bacterium]